MRKRLDLFVLILCLALTYSVWQWGISRTVQGDSIVGYWNVALGGGIIMSFVIYAMVYALSSAGARATELAEAMTSDLHKYKLALDAAFSHVVITDPDGHIVYANKSVAETTGYPLAEVMGNTPRLWGQQMSADFYTEMWRIIKEEKRVFRGEILNKKKDGELYTARATISPIIDATGELLGFVGVEENISAEKKHRESIERMNKLMVDREIRMAELKKELARARRQSS